MLALARSLILGTLLFPSVSAAVTISFDAVDLADVVAGEDLWQYRYQVGDFSFDAGFGFSVLFAPSLYTSLQPPPPVNADWDPIVLQPDPLLPDDGIYDALALVSQPSLAEPFVVSFVWLGSGEPSAQPFVIFDDAFRTIQEGETVRRAVAGVPEPAAAIVFAVGFLGMFVRRSGRSRGG